MKNQHLRFKPLATSTLLLLIVLFISSCNSNGDTKKQKEVTPPALDIHSATFLGDLDAIEQHILAGSDLNAQEETMGSTALIAAALFGKTEVSKALIEGGADVNIKNKEGSTALHTAAFFCRTDIVKMLLENGAQKDVLNNYGSTALQSVQSPFEMVEAIYDQFSKDLGPLGFKLDYDQLRETRPVIAELLQ